MTAGVPLVTISGKHDLITVPEDNRVTISKLGDAVVEDVLVDGGHIVFMIGKNASYINTTIIPNLIKLHNAVTMLLSTYLGQLD